LFVVEKKGFVEERELLKMKINLENKNPGKRGATHN
jgi:hypothetical protein